MVIVRQ